MPAKCGNCDFYVHPECHRHAPTPLPRDHKHAGTYVDSVWPTVHPDNFCGDWCGEDMFDNATDDKTFDRYMKKVGVI